VHSQSHSHSHSHSHTHTITITITSHTHTRTHAHTHTINGGAITKRYEEEENAEAFFVPFIWRLVYEHTQDLCWKGSQITMFRALGRVGGEGEEEGEGGGSGSGEQKAGGGRGLDNV
jgi:hypothetical protein